MEGKLGRGINSLKHATSIVKHHLLDRGDINGMKAVAAGENKAERTDAEIAAEANTVVFEIPAGKRSFQVDSTSGVILETTHIPGPG